MIHFEVGAAFGGTNAELQATVNMKKEKPDKTSPLLFRWIDIVIVKLLRIKSKDEEDYFEARDEKYIKQIKHILKDMDIIDSKSAALLTHVSVMLAIVIGLSSLDTTSSVAKLILHIEAVLYVIVTFLLMRCVDIMGPPVRKILKEDDKIETKYLLEVLIRRSLYQISVRSVIWLTAALVVIVFLEYFSFV